MELQETCVCRTERDYNGDVAIAAKTTVRPRKGVCVAIHLCALSGWRTDGDFIMMLPVPKFKGHQPIAMVTFPWPLAIVCGDPTHTWFRLASPSLGLYRATPPVLFYAPPPPAWLHHLIQWERPTVEVVSLPAFYPSFTLPSTSPLPKVTDWISAEEPLLLSNQIVPRGHAPSNFHVMSLQPLLPVRVEDNRRERDGSCRRPPLSVPPLISSTSPGGDLLEWAGPLCLHLGKGVWPRPSSPSCLPKRPWLRSFFRPHPLPQVDKQIKTPGRMLLTNLTYRERGMKRKVLGETERREERGKCVHVCIHRDAGHEDDHGEEGETTERRPVASTPVPGSPWCIVWTGDNRIFYFNPTIHLSVWEMPGDLIGQDISDIIKDPPHKRKKTSDHRNSFCPHVDVEDEDGWNPKKDRIEESLAHSDKLIPLERRVTQFREMLLERGVSAFSRWDKELHKMVFDSRYLLLTSDQRKQVFEQFVKSRIKEEYKEKKSKLLQAKEEFKKLLEEVTITSRSSFKEFCQCYRSDHRFQAFNRRKEQEVLFDNYITSLKRRDKENRVRLRKMR